MLASALRRLDETGNVDEKLYAIETPNKGRRYVLMSPEQAWDAISHTPVSHYYEVLTGPCDLYLDIEWKTDGANLDRELARVKEIIQHVGTALADAYGEQAPVTTMASASGESKGGYKVSWHVHMNCPKVCWANAAAVGQFVRRTCGGLPEVDKVPYSGTGQNWRCVGSSKVTEPSRRFAPVNRSTFNGCTVQKPVYGRQLIVPDETVRASIKCAHWLETLASSLGAGGTARMISENRCVVPFAQRQHCEHVGRTHRSNHQYAIINTRTLLWKMGCHACPDQISEWRTFPYEALDVAFRSQTQQHVACNRKPAVRAARGATAEKLDLRALGPPPYRDGSAIECRDGVYTWL